MATNILQVSCLFFFGCCCLILCWSRLVLVPVFLFLLSPFENLPEKKAAATGRCTLLIGRSLLFPGKTDTPHGTKWFFVSRFQCPRFVWFIVFYLRLLQSYDLGMGWLEWCVWFLAKIFVLSTRMTIRASETKRVLLRGHTLMKQGWKGTARTG